MVNQAVNFIIHSVWQTFEHLQKDVTQADQGGRHEEDLDCLSPHPHRSQFQPSPRATHLIRKELLMLPQLLVKDKDVGEAGHDKVHDDSPQAHNDKERGQLPQHVVLGHRRWIDIRRQHVLIRTRQHPIHREEGVERKRGEEREEKRGDEQQNDTMKDRRKRKWGDLLLISSSFLLSLLLSILHRILYTPTAYVIRRCCCASSRDPAVKKRKNVCIILLYKTEAWCSRRRPTKMLPSPQHPPSPDDISSTKAQAGLRIQTCMPSYLLKTTTEFERDMLRMKEERARGRGGVTSMYATRCGQRTSDEKKPKVLFLFLCLPFPSLSLARHFKWCKPATSTPLPPPFPFVPFLSTVAVGVHARPPVDSALFFR